MADPDHVRGRAMKPQCPSVGTASVMYHEPCNGPECMWWKGGGCSAQATVVPLLKISRQKPKTCDIALSCRWHMDAVRSGESACVVRRSGDLCQHQGGEYNTFDLEINYA